MSKKAKIILITVLLSLFLVIMIIIAVIKTAPNNEADNFNPNYAVNDTKESTDDEDVPEEEIKNIYINDREITHLERLTPEQYAAKSQMYTLLHNKVASDETDTKKVVTEEITESSNKFDVFIYVTFSDNTSQVYVISYDATSLHKYLRCMTLEEYEYYNSDANCG